MNNLCFLYVPNFIIIFPEFIVTEENPQKTLNRGNTFVTMVLMELQRRPTMFESMAFSFNLSRKKEKKKDYYNIHGKASSIEDVNFNN